MDKANHRAPDLSAPDRSASDPRAGFTLIEIMVVVLLLGLVGQLVVGNMGRWIPESSLDSQVSQLRSWIDYLRSEAKVQGKPYSLELDLENHRTRLILPEEDKLVRTDDDTVASTIPMAWEDLEKWMKFDGHAFAGRPIITKGTVEITFDENGFTADQSTYLQFDEEGSELLWTLHINGLTGATSVVRNRTGERDIFRVATEADF